MYGYQGYKLTGHFSTFYLKFDGNFTCVVFYLQSLVAWEDRKSYLLLRKKYITKTKNV